MNNPFAAPASSSGIEWKDLYGSLLLIEPTGIETGIPTVHGESEAVRVKLVPLDGPLAGTLHDDALVFPRVLQSQLRTRIGQKVLGRLGQGQAKQGQSAPWVLAEATEQDVQMGMRYLQTVMQPGAQQQQQPMQQQYQAPVQQQQQQYQQPPMQQQPPVQQQYQAPVQQQQPPMQQAPAAQYQATTTDAAQQALQQQLGAQPIQAPAAPAAPQVDAEKIKQFLGLGLSDAEISGATGASLEVIAAIRNLP